MRSRRSIELEMDSPHVGPPVSRTRALSRSALSLLAGTVAMGGLAACLELDDEVETDQIAQAASGGGVTIDVLSTQSWSGGFNGALRITNNSFPAPITSFEIVFRLSGNAAIPGQAWNGNISAADASGNRTATNPAWLPAGPIATGQSWDLGFTASGVFSGSTIQSARINGQTIPLDGSDGGGNDTVPPTATLAASAAQVTTAGPLTLSATASDNVGVARVEFLDGTTVLGSDTSSPYSFTVNLTAAQNGSHTYRARAVDAANNTGSSTAVTVTVNISGGNPNPQPTAKFVGNITTSNQVRSDFGQYWNQITPENEGKWGVVEGTRDVMNWGPLDAVYNYARANGIPFKGHTMVWGSQQPGWISNLSAAEQRAEVEEWIQAFCARYPDTALLDVVNEPPPHTTPPYMNAIGGAGASGFDWIIWSFQKARQYCPRTILILNDFNVLRWDTDRFIGIVNAVKGSGFIDAIGAQAHGLETQSFAELQSNLNRVLGTGLPLYISEYDLDIADDTQQRNVMQQQFTLFWNTPQIRGITLWGYIYGSTWRPNTGLIRNGQFRPAMTWLMDFLP